MSVSNIIFDWDGTLAKTLDLWLAGYQVAFERRGHKFDAKTIVSEFFHNHHEVPERYPDLEFPIIAEETRSYVFAALSSVELYDGVFEVLSGLAQQEKTVTLVTSSSRHLLEKALASKELQNYFSSIIAGDDGFGHKPSTQPFEETIKRIDASPESTAIVGDTHVDIQAGQSLGCKTCWFAPLHNGLFHDFDCIRKLSPDHEISDLRELLQIS
nr:HAD-IA family hydrolase [uncultured Cohaesibacter sp.]